MMETLAGAWLCVEAVPGLVDTGGLASLCRRSLTYLRGSGDHRQLLVQQILTAIKSVLEVDSGTPESTVEACVSLIVAIGSDAAVESGLRELVFEWVLGLQEDSFWKQTVFNEMTSALLQLSGDVQQGQNQSGHKQQQVHALLDLLVRTYSTMDSFM
jgi:hypothetical protein